MCFKRAEWGGQASTGLAAEDKDGLENRFDIDPRRGRFDQPAVNESSIRPDATAADDADQDATKESLDAAFASLVLIGG